MSIFSFFKQRTRRGENEQKEELALSFTPPRSDDYELLALVLEALEEGVLLLSERMKVLRFNAAAKQLLLLKEEDLQKPLLEVLRNVQVFEFVKKVAQSKERQEMESEVGGLLPRLLQVRGYPLQNSSVLLVFSDITEMRKLEKMRTDFVSNASHELRTPLTGLLSSLETLEMVLQKESPSSLTWVEMGLRNGKRLFDLVEDLLQLSRLDAHKLKFSKEAIQVSLMVEHVFSFFSEKAEKKKSKLVLSCAESFVFYSDRKALEHVLVNLIDNAIKYGPEGVEVRVEAKKEKEALVLSVADNGDGIEEQHLDRIFERFYRVDQGRSRDQGGTGLGLAIAKYMVEELGGTLSVESKIKEGTTFMLTVPALP